MLICKICGYEGKSNHINTILTHLQDVHDITRGNRKNGVTSKFLEYLTKYYNRPRCACGCGKLVNLHKRKMKFNLFANDCELSGKFNNPGCPEFYLFRGYSVDKTIEIIRKIQHKNVSAKIKESKCFLGDKNPSSLKSIQNRTGETLDYIKQKLSHNNSGDRNGFYGKKHNREILEKLAIARSKQSKTVTRPELVIFGILSAFNIKFRYEPKVDVFVVDFLVNDKIIIEVYGDYWHSEKYKGGFKKKKDDERIKVFKDLNYDVYIFWESEIMKKTQDIVKRIKLIFGVK